MSIGFSNDFISYFFFPFYNFWFSHTDHIRNVNVKHGDHLRNEFVYSYLSLPHCWPLNLSANKLQICKAATVTFCKWLWHLNFPLLDFHGSLKSESELERGLGMQGWGPELRSPENIFYKAGCVGMAICACILSPEGLGPGEGCRGRIRMITWACWPPRLAKIWLEE